MVDFKYDGGGIGKGGTVTITVDDKPVAEGRVERHAGRSACRSTRPWTIGEDTGTPVSEDYQVPFQFTGTIDRVAVRLGDAALTPEEQREFDEIRGRGVMAE